MKEGDPQEPTDVLLFEAEPRSGTLGLVQPAVDAAPITPAEAYLIRLAASSRQRQFYALQTIVETFTSGRSKDPRTFAWASLRYNHSAALRSKLVEKYAPNTVNRLLSAYRGVIKECFRLGLMSADDSTRVADVANAKLTGDVTGRMVMRDEMAALYDACAVDAHVLLGVRDTAMLAVLDGAGVRRAELAGIDYPKGWIGEEGAIVVLGKGRKLRKAPLPASAIERLRGWLHVRGAWPGKMFCKVYKETIVVESEINAEHVRTVVQKRCTEAAGKHLTPHDFRRTVISRLLDKGVDLKLVSGIVGHVSVNTTARYDRRGDKHRKRAIEKLDTEDEEP